MTEQFVDSLLDLQTKAMGADSEARYAQVLNDIRISDNPWACLKAAARGIEHNLDLNYLPYKDLARLKVAGETVTLTCIHLPILKAALSRLAPQIARADRKRAIEAGLQIMAETIDQWDPQKSYPNGNPVYLRPLIEKKLNRQLPRAIKTNAG